MTEPDEVRFACIGCGTFNPASAEICAGCGHRFAGPDLISKVRVALPPRAFENPYEAPLSRIGSSRTFQIGSILAWIAVIAVCLGAFREAIGLGVITSISLIPATLRTSFVARNRKAQGRSMELIDRFSSFLLTMIATWMILAACVIAFVATCFPVGLASSNLAFACFVGGGTALACGVWLTRTLLKNFRESDRERREIRYR